MFRLLRFRLAVLTVVLGVTLVPEYASAQQSPSAPFQLGATYHLEYLGADGDIRVLSPPDADGLVAVVILRGFGGTYSGQQVWINTRMAILVQKVDARTGAATGRPKSSAEENSYLASMKSDLRNAATAQEGYFADHQVYLSGSASNVAGVERPLVALGKYLPSMNVEVTFSATASIGWSGVATHIGTNKTCAMFIGVAAVAPATLEGEPRCTP